MKKVYLQPITAVLAISTTDMVAVSGDFIEGETTTEEIHDGTIDGGNAWSRRNNVWDDEDW